MRGKVVLLHPCARRNHANCSVFLHHLTRPPAANFCTGVLTFCAQIVYYMFSFNYKHLEAPISGGWPILAALLVTIKQR